MTGTPAASGTRRRWPRSPLQNQVGRPLQNVRAAGNGHPGDEMLESDRLEWGRDLRQPDGRRRDHGHAAMILVEDVIGLRTRSKRASPFQHLQARRPKTSKRDIISILVPGLGKAENAQSVVTPALTDHVHLVGDGVDVERGTHELTSRMTGMALKVRTYQTVCGKMINPDRDARRSG